MPSLRCPLPHRATSPVRDEHHRKQSEYRRGHDPDPPLRIKDSCRLARRGRIFRRESHGRGAASSDEAALQTATENAKQLNATVNFQHVDILKDEIPFQELEFIVSNPPYVAVSEKEAMNSNVLDHEPHLALFVSDNDPLIFYNVIAKKGFHALTGGGRIVVEINERFGKEVCDIFLQVGFAEAHVIKDLQNKNRIVSAIK